MRRPALQKGVFVQQLRTFVILTCIFFILAMVLDAVMLSGESTLDVQTSEVAMVSRATKESRGAPPQSGQSKDQQLQAAANQRPQQDVHTRSDTARRSESKRTDSLTSERKDSSVPKAPLAPLDRSSYETANRVESRRDETPNIDVHDYDDEHSASDTKTSALQESTMAPPPPPPPILVPPPPPLPTAPPPTPPPPPPPRSTKTVIVKQERPVDRLLGVDVDATDTEKESAAAVSVAKNVTIVEDTAISFSRYTHKQFSHTLLANFDTTGRGGVAARNSGDDPTQLLVMTPGESGDSLVARLIMMMGAYGGEREEFYLYGSGANPHELWERRDVTKLNQLLISAARFKSDVYETAIGFRPSNVDSKLLAFFQGRARRLVRLLDDQGLWVLKEPRLCILSQFWMPLLRSPVCVLVYRHPYHFAASLLRRRFSAWRHFEWITVWEKYHISALQGCSGRPKVVVRHDDLLHDPAATVQKLLDDLRAHGVAGLDMVPLATLRSWMPQPARLVLPPEAAISAMISQTQLELMRAFEDGTIVHWNVAPERAPWRDDIVLPQEDAMLGAETDGLFENLNTPLQEVIPTIAIDGAGGSEQRDVIAVYGNTAFVFMVKNIVCNFNTLELSRYIILSLDDELCKQLRVVDAPCFFDRRWKEGVRDIQFWTLEAGSEYSKLLVMKISYVHQILMTDHNILLIDADTAFYQNVHRFIADNYADYDLVLQSDARITNSSTEDWVCAGFFYMRSNARTIALVEEWQRLMKKFGVNDQDTLQLLLTGHGQKYVFPTPMSYTSANDLNVRWTLLDPFVFPNGNTLFDLDEPAKRGVTPMMAHANMRPLKRKIRDMERHGLWHLNNDADGCSAVEASH